MNKLFGLIGALLLVFASIPGIAFATEPGYRIDHVEVNDVPVNANNIVKIERGETAVIEVLLLGLNGTFTDVRVEAEIFGYERGTIEDVSDIFTIEPGVTYRTVLRLEIPEDLEPSSEDYSLRIRVSDRDNSISERFTLRVKEVRHFVNILDVIFNPGLDVEAGSNLFSIVRLENLGEKKEEDIKVTMSIPELGLSNSAFVDELISQRAEDNNPSDDDEEDSASTDELLLRIPKNAKGEYDLKITVDYNRGNTVEEATYKLLVTPAEVVKTPTDGEPAEVSTVVSIDTTRQNIEQGQGAVFKFMFANLGDATKTYSLDVTGVDKFGTYRVDPQAVTVAKDQTGDLALFVAADEDAQPGMKTFSVKVMEGAKVIKQVSLTADVTEGKTAVDPWSNVRTGLEVGFFILLIILVILGLVIAARRIGRKDDLEEPSNTQSYY